MDERPKGTLCLDHHKATMAMLGILNVITKSRLSSLNLVTVPKNAKPIPHTT